MQYYRALVRIMSKNIYLYTEMITCDAFLHTDRKHYKVNSREKGLTIQLAGSDPKKYGKCAKIIEEQGYSEINLNIGCPSTKVIKGDFGACLMNSPELVSEFIYEIKISSSLPVSIKTRLGLGYEHNLNLLYNLIDQTHKAGCNKFFIHARNAILDGLSPKKNRKIPLLRYSGAGSRDLLGSTFCSLCSSLFFIPQLSLTPRKLLKICASMVDLSLVFGRVKIRQTIWIMC